MNPEIPQHPVFTSDTISLKHKGLDCQIPTCFESGDNYTTVNARSALWIGLKSMELEPGDEILVPSYHCPVMIFPIRQLNLVPVYYNINKDCSADFHDLEKKMSSKTRAVLVVHFFGFPSPLQAIKQLCRQYGVYLIEDCAHCFWGAHKDQFVGETGDIAISSIWKFFPSTDGGILRINNERLQKKIKISRPSLGYEFKSAVNTIETGHYKGVSKNVIDRLTHTKDMLWNFLKGDDRPHLHQPGKASGPYSPEIIAPTYKSHRGSFFSKQILKFTDKPGIIETRRRNYNSYVGIFENFRNIIPVKGTLPENAVPYVFPIVSKNINRVAASLRQNRVNILRFGEFLAEKNISCKTSINYSSDCIQLPVHQSLSQDKISYIGELIRKLDNV